MYSWLKAIHLHICVRVSPFQLMGGVSGLRYHLSFSWLAVTGCIRCLTLLGVDFAELIELRESLNLFAYLHHIWLFMWTSGKTHWQSMWKDTFQACEACLHYTKRLVAWFLNWFMYFIIRKCKSERYECTDL